MNEIIRVFALMIGAIVLYFSLGRIYRAKYREQLLRRTR
jgi:hypothetical protein